MRGHGCAHLNRTAPRYRCWTQEKNGQIVHDGSGRWGLARPYRENWTGHSGFSTCSSTRRAYCLRLVHAAYGYDNVGFHLGREIVTWISTARSRQRTYRSWNAGPMGAVFANLPVQVTYLPAEELKMLNTGASWSWKRSAHCDSFPVWMCAPACASREHHWGDRPLQIVDLQNMGGVRMTIQCGGRALAD